MAWGAGVVRRGGGAGLVVTFLAGTGCFAEEGPRALSRESVVVVVVVVVVAGAGAGGAEVAEGGTVACGTVDE